MLNPKTKQMIDKHLEKCKKESLNEIFKTDWSGVVLLFLISVLAFLAWILNA
jgi:hypothetical protein